MRAIRQTESASSDIPQPTFDAFCANLLKGLHAAAQPLTILRAGLSQDCTGRMNLSELRDLTETAAGEIERLCELFSNLKQLIQAERFQAKCSEIALSTVLEKALLEAHGSLPHTEVCLPDELPAVLADPKDAEQVFSIALKVAGALSPADSALELADRCTEDCVEIRLTNPTLNLHALTAEYSLALALAEARMRSQGGRLDCGLQPFSVTIAFRPAHSKNEEDGR